MPTVISNETRRRSEPTKSPDEVFPDPTGELPIRAELFGLESLEQHAREMSRHSVLQLRRSRHMHGRSLLPRLRENAEFLNNVNQRIFEAHQHRRPVSSVAEWLWDNYHIIEEVIEEIGRDLPRGFYRQLPKLAVGSLAGFPRVYAVALALVAHTDSSLDDSHLTKYLGAFQVQAPLTIGELWAFPTMLRLALVENLRRVAGQMISSWDAGEQAATWAARISPNGPAGARDVETAPVAGMPTLSDAVVSRLNSLFRDRGTEGAAALSDLKLRCAEAGISIEDALAREHRREAADQVTVGNCITSLRLLAALDWNSFVEGTSLVESILRRDPGGVYPRQDFATRNRCRAKVEKLARRSAMDEQEVAETAVALAGEVGGNTADRHVPHYLIGAGEAELRRRVGYRSQWSEAILEFALARPSLVYFGLVATAIAAVLWALMSLAANFDVDAWPLALIGLIPASEVAVGFVNLLLTTLLPPRVLPKLDFRDGIPADCGTFVVMPSMLTSAGSASALLARLEVHYLANPDPQLRFALLTDLPDSPTEQCPEDQPCVQAAVEGVGALNRRYCGDGPERFFLFHRRRRWNPAERCWMGWERKRGKLAEFNRLLRGDRSTTYSIGSGARERFADIRFVITLDTDTRLPRDAAHRLVGTLAHPLNRPQYDPAAGRVTRGYGILQPRVSFAIPSSASSAFTRLWTRSAGIDPYSTAVSDVYHDLFGVGTFTGKGIYEVDAFEAAVGDTFPENRILSHDLIEGNFARCGLVTDIELFDDFPSGYLAHARRDHRWVRGDWQLLPWLKRTVPVPARESGAIPPITNVTRPVVSVRNALPLLERWKILDNLRRSLVAPALVAMLIAGWTVLPGSPWLWSAAVLAVTALPLLLQAVGVVFGTIRSGSLDGLRQFGRDGAATLGQVALANVFLADQARLMADAIGRTLARMLFTGRRLLEWEASALAERRITGARSQCFREMWAGPLLAVFVGSLLVWFRPDALPAAGAFLAAWFAAPLVAHAASRVRAGVDSSLSAEERKEFRVVARKTWSFFETFVGNDDNWLPPDNFQEDPREVIAHRTSPTNKGLLLLSTLAAHDLGYLGLRSLLDRLDKTFSAFDRLERHRGHFYNWYDTRSLQPLEPRYVSTVDSGNMLACLMGLKQGLLEKSRAKPDPEAWLNGLADTADVAAEALAAPEPGWPRFDDVERQTLRRSIDNLRQMTAVAPHDLVGCLQMLDRAANSLPAMLELLRRTTLPASAPRAHLLLWLGRMLSQVQEFRTELHVTAPWLTPLSRIGERPLGLGGDESAVARWAKLHAVLAAPADSAEISVRRVQLLSDLKAFRDSAPAEMRDLLDDVSDAVRKPAVDELSARCRALADRADRLGAEMDFRFLYRSDRHLFSIGFNVAAAKLDGPSYDLLASESRLASYLAIARGEAPRKHWFRLGRQLTRAVGGISLLSWSGTMFEYLMPRLLMHNYPNTILEETCRTVVARNIEYGRQRSVPWGISESAYSARDASFNYQYQAFGVPGLGLKRGLGRELVVAPYAAALACGIQPQAVAFNFRRLAAEGALGAHGFYEAIDYTPARLRTGTKSAVVRCFMAHHQGMSLVALSNCLLGDRMPHRFHSEPLVRSAELLLQERLPAAAPLVPAQHDEEAIEEPLGGSAGGPRLTSRRLTTAFTASPRTHLLSNGRYSVMVDNAGAGYGTCRALDVTRWREDATCDAYGQFCYVRDLHTGRFWSSGHQPTRRAPAEYEVLYSADKAEFRRVDDEIETHTEIIVAPDKDAEVRRVKVVNRSARTRVIELTSYAEVVLLPRRDDASHPAFGKLFLETEWLPQPEALLCRRRPRSAEQRPVWAVHVVAADGPMLGPVGFETDRARFLGRGRTVADPAAMAPGAALSGTIGAVLDPVFSLRRCVRLEPGGSAVVTFATAFAESREEAAALADHYHDPQALTRAFELAWAHSQLELRDLRFTAEEGHLYQRLASHVIFAGSTLRAAPAVLASNLKGQPDLWRHGISGDRPIVLAKVAAPEEVGFARQMVAAHSFWQRRGLDADLVILNEQPSGYLDELQNRLQELQRTGSTNSPTMAGRVILLKADHLPHDDRTLLAAAARVTLSGSGGPVAGQLDRLDRSPAGAEPGGVERLPRRHMTAAASAKRNLIFENGFGGFTSDGREYVMPDLSDMKAPPAPWSNVIANARCGCLVSDGGSIFTWTDNSRMFRLTPWSNDPVSDAAGEAVYLRDEESGEIWTPTPRPAGAAGTTVRHGAGYTVFEQEGCGLKQELRLTVPADKPVKLATLKVLNTGRQPRRLSATFYAEWVLGVFRDDAPMQVVTETDSETGALLARNRFNPVFASHIAFADVSVRPRSLTADRTEFLGRNGSAEHPAALSSPDDLSLRTGAGLDPCAAIRAPFDLQPGESKEITFVLGAAEDLHACRSLVLSYREAPRVAAAVGETERHWDRILGTVQVRTPNAAMDLLLNRWLLYQVLGCRILARSAFYQSGGAYGFRDQLQDSMALVYAAPGEARAHILRAAGRQFLEGDVQHWWHPPGGRGVRTRISDSALWLPFVVCRYVEATGDAAILDERIPFLKAPQLAAGQHDDYSLPATAEGAGTLYEHCVRAMRVSERFGRHGLPTMGSGDWNDGMNRVGDKGEGESVWNGWFLFACLTRFSELAKSRDAGFAEHCRATAARLKDAIEQHGWDGAWYRRAYFDDGTPLGSRESAECRIDSIAQSWALISGAGDPARARMAMESLESRLIRDSDKLILLLTPPFDTGDLQPGYIKGYLPGIRENGGQYTHAATWVVLAETLLGRGGRAVELFDMLNPIRRTATAEDVARYKVEPYVLAADVYALPPHVGRGGWTWYTGSAAWMYRVGLESILGFRKAGDRLTIAPCIPAGWPRYEIRYRFGSSVYEIVVENPRRVERGVAFVTVDGRPQDASGIELRDDGRPHTVRVVMG